MRIRLSAVVVGASLAVCQLALAQRPDEKVGDRPPPAAEGQRGGRSGFVPGDEPPPPPGKAGPRGRRDGDGPPGGPDGLPRGGGGGRGPGFAPPGAGFGGGGSGMRGGFGGSGYGGFGGGSMGYGGMMPGGGPYGMPMPGGEGSDDPQMRELMKQDADMDKQTHELAAKIREARGDDRTKLKTQLADLVSKHFEVRQKRREHQLQRMEEELKRLRDTIAKRNSSRDTIIDNHVKELVGDPRDLDF